MMTRLVLLNLAPSRYESETLTQSNDAELSFDGYSFADIAFQFWRCASRDRGISFWSLNQRENRERLLPA